MGWRADAVRLMGRWESEVVRVYTRLAPLEAPTEPALAQGLLDALIELTGTTRAAAPVAEPWARAAEPEIDDIPIAEWILNTRTDKFHRTSAIEGFARCGWAYARTELHVQGVSPPRWYWAVCSACSPALHLRLKKEAEALAEAVKVGPAQPRAERRR